MILFVYLTLMIPKCWHVAAHTSSLDAVAIWNVQAYNKQLILVMMDMLLQELFPEITSGEQLLTVPRVAGRNTARR